MNAKDQKLYDELYRDMIDRTGDTTTDDLKAMLRQTKIWRQERVTVVNQAFLDGLTEAIRRRETADVPPWMVAGQ